MKVLLLLFLTLPLFAEEEPQPLTPAQVRHLLREARQLYTSEEPEDLANAARMFRAAAEAADPDEVHLDAVRLGEAMAWIKANQTEQALEAFERIQGFEDAADRARHRNLRGNAHLAAGEQAFAQEEFEAAKEHMESAVQSFIESLQDNPASEDGKRNLEIAHRRLRHVIENTPPPPPPDESGESEGSDEDDADDQQDQTDPTDQSDPSDEDESDPSDESDPTDQSDPIDQTDPSDPSDPSASEPLPEEDFSEEEAQRTLDALLEQERRLRDEILRNRNLQTVPVEKDW
jgi:hypothetical protein